MTKNKLPNPVPTFILMPPPPPRHILKIFSHLSTHPTIFVEHEPPMIEGHNRYKTDMLEPPNILPGESQPPTEKYTIHIKAPQQQIYTEKIL